MKNSKSTSSVSKVIVVGAGLAGLASAALLAAKGKDVLVFEANPEPGGKARSLLLGDYRFDTGPSLFTMPEYLDAIFTACKKKSEDYIKIQKLDVLCKYFYQDRTFITAFADKKKFATEAAWVSGEEEKNVLNFLSHAEAIFNITEHIFVKRSLHKLKNYFRLKVLWSLWRFPKIKAFSTMDAEIRKRIKTNKLRQIFLRYATYNGSNPFVAPGTLNLIPHLEYGKGAYLPKGGIHSVTKALYQLCLDMGVNFLFDSPVDKIVTSERAIQGVKAFGKFYPADAVVSNMDVYFTYTKLLKDFELPKKIKLQERSSSALIFYWGINKSFSQLDVHNILFTNNYQKEFELLFSGERIYEDPTVYIHITSKLNKEDAPEGAENWFILINAPAHKGQNWETIVSETRQNTIKKINSYLNTDIEKAIVCEEILTPENIEQKTFSYQGSLYGSSSNNRNSAFMRQANFSSKIKGLYFCGGSVHPGGGIPLVLSSAQIVADLIE